MRFPRLRLTATIEHQGSCGHQSLERDQLEYYGMFQDCSQLANQLVCKHLATASSPIARANQGSDDDFHKRTIFTV